MMCSIGAAWADTAVLSPATATTNDGGTWNFKNAFIITNANSKGYSTGTSDKFSGIKYSAGVQYTISLPKGVSVSKIQIEGYCNDSNADAYISEINGKTYETTDYVFPKGKTSANNKTYAIEVSGVKDALTFTIGGKQLVANITLTYDIVPITEPILSSSEESLTFSLNPYVRIASATFKLTGQNLTDGTYNLTVPSVEGITVTPNNFTVSDGVVEQEFTVSYTSEVNVEKATANIVAATATTDNVSVTIPVTYSANITGYEQTIVTGTKTWDWTSITETVQLTADTKPSINDAIVLKNLEDRITFPATFDAQALVVQAEYPSRNKKFQNGTIMFKTPVAGYITVDFADTGKSISGETTNRYLNVNGVNTEYYVVRTGSSDGRKTTGEIFVPAGEVVIKGRNADNTADAAYCLYKLTFTPVFPQTITITDAKFATCVANSNLDFTSSDVTAYAVTDVTATAVELTKVEKVKAGQAIVVGAEAAGNYDIPVATEDFEGTESLMKSSAEKVDVTEENSHYIVANGDNGVGFYPVKVGTAIPAGKGYLTVETANAAKFLSFGLDATGISEVKAAATEGNGEIYNLNGQRVAAPSKGLYIMNGKKVIFK